MAKAAIRSKTMILLLLIRCLLLPRVCSMFCCVGLRVFSSFAFILMETRELVALLCLSDCYCSVSLLHGAVGWSDFTRW